MIVRALTTDRIKHFGSVLLGFGHSVSSTARALGVSDTTIRRLCLHGGVDRAPVAVSSPSYSRELHHYVLGRVINSPGGCIPTADRVSFRITGAQADATEMCGLFAKFCRDLLYSPRQAVFDRYGDEVRVSLLSEEMFLAIEQVKDCSTGKWNGAFGIKEPFLHSRHFWRGVHAAGPSNIIGKLPAGRTDRKRVENADFSLSFSSCAGPGLLQALKLALPVMAATGLTEGRMNNSLPPYRTSTARMKPEAWGSLRDDYRYRLLFTGERAVTVHDTLYGEKRQEEENVLPL